MKGYINCSRQLALFLCLFCLSFGAKAQTVAGTEIISASLPDINLGNQALPFDIPFDLSLTVPADYISVSGKYRLADDKLRKKYWVSFPNPQLIDAGGWMDLNAQDKTGTTIRMHCPGMHPNRSYDFEFVVLKKIVNDDKSKIELRNKIGEVLIDFFKRNEQNSIDQQMVLDVAKEIDNVLVSHLNLGPGNTLVYAADPSKTFQTDLSSTLGGAADRIMSPYGIKQAAEINLNGQGGMSDAIKQLSDVSGFLLSKIDAILDLESKPNAELKALLGQTVNPALSDFKGYTIKDGLIVLRRLASNVDPLYRSLLNGTVRISNNDIVNSNSRDVQGIAFLTHLIRFLNEDRLKFTVDDTLENPFGPNEKGVRPLQKLLNAQVNMSKNIQDISDAEALLKEAVLTIPDLTANLIISQSFKRTIISLADVESNKTPYISVEAGVGYSHSFASVFSYYGANIYLAPVNKKAPLNAFNTWYALKKMLSFQVGIATFYNDRPENTRSILGKDSKVDLALGIGLRVTRVFKLNAGVMPYKSNDHNPLGKDYKVKLNGFVSLGIDVNLLGALGKVSDLLKL